LVNARVALGAIWFAGCHAGGPALYGADVVATFHHSAEAFTEGLELYDGQLYESVGLRGCSSLRLVELETGIIGPRQMLAPDLYAEGLTIFGDRIYQVTYQAHRCLVYDAATLDPLGELAYDGEAWGLTHDDTSLI